MFKERKKKIFLIVAIVLLLIIVAAVISGYILFKPRTFSVVLVSDIHLGTSLCNPKQCNEKVEGAFQEVLDKAGDDLIITGGDNTDASEYSKDQVKATELREGYKKRLLEMAGDREILWANGNHDRDTYLSGKEYYSYVKNNWRFIIIHTTDVEGEQLGWLIRELKNNDENKIVIMHHPVFKQGTKKIIDRYRILMELFNEYNVKYVFSGHWHSDHWEREVDGVTYKAIRGLTYKYKTNYETINLDYKLYENLDVSPSMENFLKSTDNFLEGIF